MLTSGGCRVRTLGLRGRPRVAVSEASAPEGSGAPPKVTAHWETLALLASLYETVLTRGCCWTASSGWDPALCAE